MPRMLAKLRPPPLCATLAAPDQQAVGLLIGVANEYLRVLGLREVDAVAIGAEELQLAMRDLAAAQCAFAAAGADAWADWVDYPYSYLFEANAKMYRHGRGEDLDRLGVVS